MKKLFSLCLLVIIACSDDNEPKNNNPPIPTGCKVVGAKCKTGGFTENPSDCDAHGGVEEWLCDK